MRFEEETIEWHFDVWRWLLENFGKSPSLSRSALVTPSPDFYPFKPSYEHSYFEEVFGKTKELMGLADWPCTLEPMEESDPAGEVMQAQGIEGSWSQQEAAGMFQIKDDEVLIHYSPRQAQDPVALIATMAHELSHYLLATAKTDPPGGWEDHEFHTDVATTFSGFGVFQCNSAFSFQQNSDGWSSSRQGYLPESEHAYGLAIFVSLAEVETKPILRMLNPNPRSYFKKALKDLKRRPEQIARLRTIA